MPILIGFCCFTYLLVAGPARAAGVPAGGVLDLTQATDMLNSVIGFVLGPVAKLVAVLCIIGGALAFAQGREMNEGLKNLGVIAIVIGLLSAASNMVSTWTIGATV
jgi:type IV secretory pathway VirB2 component (pilin)